ncbi:hypothetical protein LCGC14_1751230 [marine sediment metagenome]|uniref:Uncharacterized protein n=1 Tax=marine sediment metagenome TaxID=412755 RepID=A0A0F9H3P9_9ZZZZ
MIKSCEDVKTMDDFQSFSNVYFNTKTIGLHETARLVIWSRGAIISSKTVDDILNYD